MKRSATFLVILQVVFLARISSQFGKWPSSISSRTTCPSPSTTVRAVCQNCTSVLDCLESPGSEVDCSACNMVCGEGSGDVATCYKSYDGTDQTSITNANCLCKGEQGSGITKPNGNYSDPYDSSSYVTCNGGVPSYDICPTGNIFDETAEICVAGSECPTGYYEDYFEMPLNCDSYIVCDTGLVEDCSDDEIFDLSYSLTITSQCIDPISDACFGATAGTTFAHPDVCYVYLSCDATGTLLSSDCCDVGEYFSTGNLDCEPYGLGSCTISPQDVGYCIQEFWEQEACNQCVDTSTIYATRTPCSNYYYECVDDGSGPKPNLVKCPTSFPIFNAINKYCDLESEVSTCPAFMIKEAAKERENELNRAPPYMNND